MFLKSAEWNPPPFFFYLHVSRIYKITNVQLSLFNMSKINNIYTLHSHATRQLTLFLGLRFFFWGGGFICIFNKEKSSIQVMTNLRLFKNGTASRHGFLLVLVFLFSVCSFGTLNIHCMTEIQPCYFSLEFISSNEKECMRTYKQCQIPKGITLTKRKQKLTSQDLNYLLFLVFFHQIQNLSVFTLRLSEISLT